VEAYGVVDRKDPNALVIADNLDGLKWMQGRYAGRFRCVYLDPPFNTGRKFAEYDDAWAPEAWRAAIEARLALVRPLLADDGAVFVEIDDTELGPLQGAMDGVFGRENRVSTVTIVRSAPTGHKAINRGPVNVTDFLLVYAKDRARWRPNALVRPRRGYDRAYRTYLENRDEPVEAWRFVPLARAARRELGAAVTREEVERFAVARAANVVRFAQPRYEAVSKAAQRMIDSSRARPEAVLRLARRGHKDMIFRGGNRVLFLSDKVKDGVLVEPLTNVWDDMPFQGIAREGGVVFVRNKKPERLLARVLTMASDPGDWVLDAFLGSGTTAAVAHKTGRRWVGIERGAHADELCVPRLRRVVDGSDPTGITREVGWGGGGGFVVVRRL
jgi:adenine-specific DNA-methyltransferase